MRVLSLFFIAGIVSFDVFALAVCEQRRPQNPHQFINDEHISRTQWSTAYRAFTSKSRRRAKTIFDLSISRMPKRAKIDFKNAVVEAYEHGYICEDSRWITPDRFIQIFELASVLHTAVMVQSDLPAKVVEYQQALSDYERSHATSESDALLNTLPNDYDELLREQAEHWQGGPGEYILFSIANFSNEARYIAEHFARKRDELDVEIAREESMRRAILAQKRELTRLRKGLEKYLVDAGLFIRGDDEQALEKIYRLSIFTSDLSHARALNRLWGEIEVRRRQVAIDVNHLSNMIDAAREHFSARNAELCVQEKMDIYSVTLDMMVSPMKRVWQSRIQDGYDDSLDALLHDDDPHLRFIYMQERSGEHPAEISECPICYDEKDLVQACADASHKLCASCFKNHLISQMQEKSVAIGCPFIGCANKMHTANYEKFMSEGIFPYEIFEAYRNRWVRKNEAKSDRCRCHMGCLFFHDIPVDKVPGQSSPPCPDCGTSTCLSCKNLAHRGSMECKALDAEAMKKAHRKMFKAGYRACPACGVWGIRVSGCDAIRCQCGQSFSYSTGEPWQSKHVVRFGYHEGDVRPIVRMNRDL